MKKTSFAALLFLVLMGVGTLPAQADPDPSQAQDWTVDGFRYFGQGLLTPMLLQTYVPSGHSAQDDGTVASDQLTRTSFRFFYGLTEHVNLFLQLNIAKPDGEMY
jgi:hypothetical protein